MGEEEAISPDRPRSNGESPSDLLSSASLGDREAHDRLVRVVYDDLHRQAERFMRRERGDHTLQPTALVNEAYLRLIRQDLAGCRSRSHFLAIAAITMRRILVEHARARNASKRGGLAHRTAIRSEILAGRDREIDMLDLDDAIEKLDGYNPRFGRVVVCKVFGEMTDEEIAEDLHVNVRTVKRDWRTAKVLLLHELKPEA